jgi:hypothetical protein
MIVPHGGETVSRDPAHTIAAALPAFRLPGNPRQPNRKN